MLCRIRLFGRVRARGHVLAYFTILLPAMVGFCSLAVDYGRAQLVKSQLLRAADAAARYGVTGLSSGTAVSNATAAALANTADGTSVVLQASDIEIGVWNSTTRTFAVSNVGSNAVRVTARRTAARGNAVPTMFAMALGRGTVDVHAVAVASTTPGVSTVINVPGGANPWLAGMPNGTTANFTNQGWVDSAPTNSPVAASGLTIKAGAILNFNFSGAVSYYPGTQPFNPDGNPSWIIDDYYATQNGGSEHGIAGLQAPLTSVIGVFLDDNAPNTTAAPPSLDFTSSASRDFSSLSPQLKQPFFIGDGVRADGVTLQSFVVPAGATRLFIGVMDGQQWSDNSGSLATTVVKPLTITSVR